jgi:hypothetical protein
MTSSGKLARSAIHRVRQMSLVRAYFSTFETAAAGLRHLNDQLGTNYQSNHRARWENGEREPNRMARAVMLHRVLPGVLKEHGKATEEDIAEALDKLL